MTPPPVNQHGQRRLRVLYIEDNDVNRHLMRRVLDRRGDVSLTMAENGVTGLRLAEHRRPDLVLLDLGLPDLPGGEVLIQIRELLPAATTRVIIVSADATTATVERMRRLGADGYVTKPFDLAAIDHVIDLALTTLDLRPVDLDLSDTDTDTDADADAGPSPDGVTRPAPVDLTALDIRPTAAQPTTARIGTDAGGSGSAGLA